MVGATEDKFGSQHISEIRAKTMQKIIGKCP